jgi:hypothetical protein
MNGPQLPEAPPERLGSIALLLALAGALVLPGLAVGLAWIFNADAQFAVGTLLILGMLSVVAAVVVAIVALVQQRGSRKSAVAALVVSAVSIPLGLVVAGFSVLLTTPMLPGRPHRVGGRARRAGASGGTDWAAGGPSPRTNGLAVDVREALVHAWLADAALEHASIAAFSALALDLLALGAPPSLIAGTHRAALDEVEHARACFALASAYAGTALTAAPFPAARAPVGAESSAERMVRLAVESAIDGCIGEGAAAAVAREAMSCASDPVVAAVLARIARDEQTHADLSWSILAWCMDVGGEPVHAAVDDALRRDVASTTAHAPFGARLDLVMHGRSGAASWAAARVSAREAVVEALHASAASSRGDYRVSDASGTAGGGVSPRAKLHLRAAGVRRVVAMTTETSAE